MLRVLFTLTIAALGLFQVSATNLDNIDPKTVESRKDNPFFVEYYKPDCAQCDNFASHWDELAKAHSDATFAKINCAEHGKYCHSKGIITLPTIQSRNSGSSWSEYTGDFSYPSVDKYINSNSMLRNKNGESIVINKSQTLKDIIASGQPWFVKFYAPWCGHCKHLQPIWIKLAKNLKGKVNIAEVDCEESKDICQEYRVTGLPTLSYFIHGANLRYTGKRELENLEKYALQMAGSPVRQLESDDELEKVSKLHDVSLVYVQQDSGNEAQQQHTLSFLETVAPGFMETIPFYASSDKKTASRFNLGANTDAIVLVKDGTYHVYKHDLKDLAGWIIQESKPLVTRVTPYNSNSIIKGTKLVVLGIAEEDDSDSEWKMREMAKIYKEEHGKDDLVFALLDGQLWANFVARTYDISPRKLPAIIVLDPKNGVFYDRHADDKKFILNNPDEILASISKLDQLKSQTTEGNKTFGRIEKLFIFVSKNWMILTPILIAFFGYSFYLMTKDEPAPLTREEMRNVAKKVVEERKKQNEKKNE